MHGGYVMMPAILVLTVFASALAAALATYYLNISKDRLVFLGRKSEELYCTIEALDFELSQFFGKRYSLVGAVHPTGDTEGLHRTSTYFATARMLVGLYFPALSPNLMRVCAAAATAQRKLEALEDAPEISQTDYLETLDASVCDLKDALAAFKVATLTTGRKANGRKFFALSPRAPEPAGAMVVR